MEIINSNAQDFDAIMHLYDLAVEYQKTKFNKHWKPFDTAMIKREIAENKQFKIIIDNQIAAIFAIAFEDPFIWNDIEPSIFLHRIVTNPDFRGQNFVEKIADWAKDYGKKLGLKYIRMDTWGDNQSLIEYYQKCGFKFLGIITPKASDTLPLHYNSITLSLFEIKI